MHNAAALMCVFLTHTLGYAHVCVPAPLATILAPLATIPAPLATILAPLATILAPLATIPGSHSLLF